ncbi:hypothetical protein D3C87_1323500 [compost metagenome]
MLFNYIPFPAPVGRAKTAFLVQPHHIGGFFGAHRDLQPDVIDRNVSGSGYQGTIANKAIIICTAFNGNGDVAVTEFGFPMSGAGEVVFKF